MKLELKSALAELTVEDHFHHPGLRNAKFIFCDDQPNENNQGIEREDFAEIIRSAVGAPVKMRFLGESVSGHVGSVPIGYINSMEETESEDGKIHSLVASATLFASEYPDEITYLEESFAEGRAPGVSWELLYDNELLKNGINWIKGIITRAATFVRNPAYGSRTALLALASNKTISEDDFSTELSAFANEFSPKITDKGGNNNVEKELQEAIDALEAANAKILELETVNASLTDANTTLSETVAEKDALLTENETALAEHAQKELLINRTRMIIEAGITVETDSEKLAKKQAFWLAFSDDSFAEYVGDLKEVASIKQPAFASIRPARVETPRFSSNDIVSEGTAPNELIGKFKTFRYTDAESE